MVEQKAKQKRAYYRLEATEIEQDVQFFELLQDDCWKHPSDPDCQIVKKFTLLFYFVFLYLFHVNP